MTHQPHLSRCEACSRSLERERAFFVRAAQRLSLKCTRCSLIDRELARRSMRIALVVGSLLVALNQGDILLAGNFGWERNWWKLPLTYLVPFCVATYGALSNGYRRADSIKPEAT